MTNPAIMLAAIAADYPNTDPIPTSVIVGTDVAGAICDAFADVILVVGSEHAASGASGAQQSVAEALVREAHHHHNTESQH